MSFRYAPEFSEDLKRIVGKPGARIFLAEALGELEKEISAREDRFLGAMRVGLSTMVGLEAKGKAQIVRGEDRDGRPRYLVRFLGAPSYVLVAVRDGAVVRDETRLVAPMAQALRLAFTAIVELSEEIARNSTSRKEAPVSRM